VKTPQNKVTFMKKCQLDSLPRGCGNTALPIPMSTLSSSVDLLLAKDRSLTVTLRDSVKFVILLHKVWKMHPYHQDYLGFYTVDSHLLSPSVHGLLGNRTTGKQFLMSHTLQLKQVEHSNSKLFELEILFLVVFFSITWELK